MPSPLPTASCRRKTTHTLNLLTAALISVLATSALVMPCLAAETSFDELANLPLAEGRPTKETAQKLRDQLLLPPDYKGAVPTGYFVYRSGTNNVFVFLRGFYEDPKNLTPAVAHLERTRIYPLNGETGAKPMKFPDASGVPANMLPISDGRA